MEKSLSRPDLKKIESLLLDRVSIRNSCHNDAQFISQNMKETDLKECYIHQVTPFTALHLPIVEDKPYTFTAFFDEEPVAMFGVCERDIYEGYLCGDIWCLTTDKIHKIPITFHEVTKLVINYLLEHFDYLENIVPSEHIETINWLQNLGFTVTSEVIQINEYSCLRFVKWKET